MCLREEDTQEFLLRRKNRKAFRMPPHFITMVIFNDDDVEALGWTEPIRLLASIGHFQHVLILPNFQHFTVYVLRFSRTNMVVNLFTAIWNTK